MEALLGGSSFLLVAILFVLSLVDIALRSVNYYKVSSIHRHGNRNAKKLFSLLSSPERAISLLLFLKTTVACLLFLTLGILIVHLKVGLAYKVFLVPVVVLACLVLIEYIPRMVAI